MAGKIVGPSGSIGKPRTTSGISGPGGKNVAPINKPKQLGVIYQIGTNPKAPSKKKGPSFMDKFVAGFKKEMTRPTQRVRSTDGDPKPKKK